MYLVDVFSPKRNTLAVLSCTNAILLIIVDLLMPVYVGAKNL